MSLARPALLALLVGVTLLASPALLLEFQEPRECANAVDPGPLPEGSASAPTVQYDDLSPDAKRAFDRARAADGSVTVYGERCPAEFDYTAQQHRYEVVADGERYVLTTYANDLLPEVPIAAGLLAFLGLCLAGLGLATRDDPGARFPTVAGGVGVLALAGTTATVVRGGTFAVLGAAGATALLTALVLVGAGVALRSRRALALGAVLSLVPALATVPLAGVSLAFVALGVLPLALVGAGVAGGELLGRVRGRAAE